MSYYKHCIDQQILNWHLNTICRYSVAENLRVNRPLQQSLGFTKQSGPKSRPLNNGEKRNINAYKKITKAYFNHPKQWAKIEAITLHATSKRLLLSNELYTAFYKCFCCCGQSPQIIKSKKAIAAFRVIKGAIIGAQSTLRNKSACFFLYKWAFLAAELSASQLIMALKYQTSLALTSSALRERGNKKAPSRPFPVKQSARAIIRRKGIPLKQGCIGVNNVFVFPELDKLDYNLFKTVPGFDLIINYKSAENRLMKKS